MALEGPSRRIVVEPQTQPTEAPAIQPVPAKAPASPEKVPA